MHYPICQECEKHTEGAERGSLGDEGHQSQEGKGYGCWMRVTTVQF